ncbi:MAG: nodulation protein NfeD [Halieaceae bacterium]
MMALIRKILAPVMLLWLCSFAGSAQADAWVIDIKGAIGPATADHMIRGLQQAAEAEAEMVILRIDTPGGLDSAMRDMIKSVLAADLPVVGYVSPSGARAASAGTYLLYATHIAAMAPGTNLGAATPVQIGAPSLPQLPAKDESEAGNAKPATAMERKIVNDAVAYIESLAQLRGRNAQWAESAVRDGASLSSEDALAKGVIDLLASSLPDLLLQLEGREIALADRVVTLSTEQLSLYEHPTDWRSEFLAAITDPSIAYILMLVGIYGLIIEFYNPGIGLPGVVGAVCLLLAMYALQVLPVSYVGLGLILLGIALMTAEAFAPSFGVLGIGGIVAFVVGSIMLMDTNVPGYQIALPVILAVSVFSFAVLVGALGLLMKARRRAVVTGLDHLLGAQAQVEVVMGGIARVRMDGELWEVACEDSLAAEDSVIIDSIDGVVLCVSKEQGDK